MRVLFPGDQISNIFFFFVNGTFSYSEKSLKGKFENKRNLADVFQNINNLS